jgi:hypothetical protein
MTRTQLLEKIVLLVDYYRETKNDEITETLISLYKDVHALENVK